MGWFKNAFSGTIGKKIVMALTGLFLVLFLIGHLAGNMQLIFGDAEGFNLYAKFMTTNPAVKILSYITYISIIFHSIYGAILSVQNKKARPVGYAYNKPDKNSTWSSRNMGILGTIILVFIVVHMQDFWYEYKFGHVPTATYLIDGVSVTLKDLHIEVMEAFTQLWYVALYVICMIALGFHLYHGFQSSFQTMGFRHNKYTPAIKGFGTLFAIVVPALFAAIPLYIYFTR
jgi:succinate dehydrogenase / fumarate reductase cytochrome b subunit